MHLFLESIKFHVDENRYNGDLKKLKGTVDVAVGAELGKVLEMSVTVYPEMSLSVNQLPLEIQNRMIELHKDIHKFLIENSKLG